VYLSQHACAQNIVVAKEAIPTIRIHLGNSIVPQRVPPKLTVMLKIPRGARSEAKNVEGSEVKSDEEAGSMLKEVEEALPMLEQSRDEGDDDDMESGPEDLANGDDSERDDMPEYELEEGEKQVTDPDYVFCPEVHRRQLLRKFSKHLCQHPFFPTSSGTYQTSSEIHRACVYDMYTFCHDRGLTEAWAYLWNSWYGCWNLWA